MTPDRKPLLLVGAVAGALALLVGLVRSADREGSRPRPGAPLQVTSPAKIVSLRVPLAPTAVEQSDLASPALAEPADPEPVLPESEPRRELARVRGLVLRPEGDPASEARVVLAQQHARCDVDGRFELVLTDAPGTADLLAFEPGYEPALRPALGPSLVSGAPTELRIVLGPSSLSLTGRVTTRDGQALKGWTVELDGPDPLADFGLRERVRTDATGHFLLVDVPAGIHVVRAFAEEPELAFRSPPIAAGEDGLVIVADPGE